MSQLIAYHDPIIYFEFNAFCLMAYGNINPRQFIERLLDSNFMLFFYSNKLRKFIELDKDNLTAFIHDHIVYNGSVDNLLCCSKDRKIVTEVISLDEAISERDNLFNCKAKRIINAVRRMRSFWVHTNRP